jgi:hypothetical protein
MIFHHNRHTKIFERETRKHLWLLHPTSIKIIREKEIYKSRTDFSRLHPSIHFLVGFGFKNYFNNRSFTFSLVLYICIINRSACFWYHFNCNFVFRTTFTFLKKKKKKIFLMQWSHHVYTWSKSKKIWGF